MAKQEGSALSQEAIDALLARGVAAESDGDLAELIDEADEETNEQADESSEAVEGFVPADSAHQAGPATEAPDVAAEIQKAVDVAVKAMAGEVAALTKRIEKAEQALEKMAELEREIQSLKNSSGQARVIETLETKVAALESGARNTPVFNLYEKMTCSACGTGGAAQVKTRCPECGKEGWFGRRTPVVSTVSKAPAPTATPKPRTLPKPAVGTNAPPQQARPRKRTA